MLSIILFPVSKHFTVFSLGLPSALKYDYSISFLNSVLYLELIHHGAEFAIEYVKPNLNSLYTDWNVVVYFDLADPTRER